MTWRKNSLLTEIGNTDYQKVTLKVPGQGFPGMLALTTPV